MPTTAQIRITKGDEAVFSDILRSLESHRPSKAETDILEKIGEHFDLPRNRKLWPAALARNRVAVDIFLGFVFDLVTPFVNMVLDLYGFLSEHAATSGGKTTHFEIRADGVGTALKFPNVNLPRRVEWIKAWTEVQTQLVSIDWATIGQALLIDGGVFYGSVAGVRLVQSLIVSRRDGDLSQSLRQAADQIYEVLRRALRCWLAREGENTPLSSRRSGVRVFVCGLDQELASRGLMPETRNYEAGVAVDLEVVLYQAAQSYGLEDAFCDPGEIDVLILGEGAGDQICGSTVAAIVFVALWGLEDKSFRDITSRLTIHEQSPSILRGRELDARGCELAQQLLEDLRACITPVGNPETSLELLQKKVDILLLPYWKDRWFLYEVWALCFPLRLAVSLGARVEFVGACPIDDPDVVGTTWNLPTQKARQPVARISNGLGNRHLLAWFQRETRRYDSPRNIEPDIRITSSQAPYVDSLILECKDRVKYSKRSASEVARAYLDGTAARSVWILNYEDKLEGHLGLEVIQAPDGRQLGISYAFRPQSVAQAVVLDVKETLENALDLKQAKPLNVRHYVVIDASGSMDQKCIPRIPLVWWHCIEAPERVYLWRNKMISSAEGEGLDLSSGRVHGTDAEDGNVLSEFAGSLPENARLTIITDNGGRGTIEGHLEDSEQDTWDPHYTQRISGRAAEVIVI